MHHIRLATAQDSTAIGRIIRGESRHVLVDTESLEAQKFFASLAPAVIEQYMAESARRCCVAEEAGKVVGMIMTRDNKHISQFFVAGTHQGQGIGRALWRFALRQAVSAGGTGEFTVDSSLIAQPIYERWGFCPVGEPMVQNGFTFMAMHRPAKHPVMQLVQPTLEHLPSYVDALARHWSYDNLRPEAAQEELALIRLNAAAFIASLEDREAKGPPITMPDGSRMPRLPGFRRWLWDGQFCGSIDLRWQVGTAALPPYCLGHIGYAVVPWKQGQGLAKAALAQLLPEAKQMGLPYVELTTDPQNHASQRVIQANGGRLVERFIKAPQFGSKPGLRFRIALA